MTASTTTSTIRLRPLRRHETGPVDAVFAGLSSHPRRLRFRRRRVRVICAMRDAPVDVDGVHHLVLMAEAVVADAVRPVGIACLIAHDDGTAEIAVVTVDAAHGDEAGRRLLVALRRRGVDLACRRLRTRVPAGNREAERMLRSVMPDGSLRRLGMSREFIAPLPRPTIDVAVTLAV